MRTQRSNSETRPSPSFLLVHAADRKTQNLLTDNKKAARESRAPRGEGKTAQ